MLVIKRRLPIIVLTLLLVFTGCGKTGTERLTIVHTNDLHGHVLPEQVAGWSGRSGGYAVFASWVKKVRGENQKENVPTVLVDAGDIFMGTPEGNLTKGGAMVDLMNALEYDVMVIGNHEFDYGYYNLKRLSEQARFPFLGANVYRSSSSRLVDFLRPFIVKQLGDLSVAFVGVVTDETPSIAMSQNVDQLIFKEPAAVVESYVRLLQEEGIDLIVVLSHLGLEEDQKLARELTEIDLIIGGHTHTLLTQPQEVKGAKALICQAGSEGRYAGRLDLWIDREQNRITKYRYYLFSNRDLSLSPDLEIDCLLERIKEEVGKEYDQSVGLALADIIPLADSESYLGNLITDAMRRISGAEVAFQNAYGIRSSLLEGPITLRDIYEVLPFDDTIVTMKLTGQQIRKVLEQSLSLEKGMLQVSGLRAEYDLKRPVGQRLLQVWIGDEELEDENPYSVATNGFLAGGGDYFQTFTRGQAFQDTGVLLRQTFEDYVRQHSPLYQGRFRASRMVEKL